MNLRDGLSEQVHHVLRNASDAQLVRSMRLVELLQARGEIDLCASGFRPRLALLQPPRSMTLARVMTLPMAGLLIPAEQWAYGRRRISRAMLRTIHSLALDSLDKDLKRSLTRIAQHHALTDGTAVLEVGHALWPRAAAALRSGWGSRRDAIRRYGDDGQEQIETALLVLDQASELVPDLWQLPAPPIRSLDPEEKSVLRRILTRAAQQGDAAFRVTVQVLIQRAEQPALILDLSWARDSVLSRAGVERTLQEAAAGYLAGLDEAISTATKGAGPIRVRSAADMAARLADALTFLEAAPRSLDLPSAAVRDLRRKAASLVESELGEALMQGVVDRLAELACTPDIATVEVIEETARAARRLTEAGRVMGLDPRTAPILAAARERFEECALAAALKEPRQPGVADPAFHHVRLAEILFGSAAAMGLLRQLRPPSEPLAPVA